MENRDLIIEINKLKESIVVLQQQIKQQQSLLHSLMVYVWETFCGIPLYVRKPPGLA
jgi:hypothetical protein